MLIGILEYVHTVYFKYRCAWAHFFQDGLVGGYNWWLTEYSLHADTAKYIMSQKITFNIHNKKQALTAKTCVY